MIDPKDHLEPAAVVDHAGKYSVHPHCVALSQAISLKRIADALAPHGTTSGLLLRFVEQIAER